VREGPNDGAGYPLLLLHPETKRIWWRNIGPLAEAGYEVIAPDLRGYGGLGRVDARSTSRRCSSTGWTTR
jgi:pimeloyl-ACP methyl ester carboxylesterase